MRRGSGSQLPGAPPSCTLTNTMSSTLAPRKCRNGRSKVTAATAALVLAIFSASSLPACGTWRRRLELSFRCQGEKFFGTATDLPEHFDSTYVAMLNTSAEFGLVTPGNSLKVYATEPRPNVFDFTNQHRRDLGVEVALTELDAGISAPTTPDKLDQQANDCFSSVKACVDTPGCASVTVWDFLGQVLVEARGLAGAHSVSGSGVPSSSVSVSTTSPSATPVARNGEVLPPPIHVALNTTPGKCWTTDGITIVNVDMFVSVNRQPQLNVENGLPTLTVTFNGATRVGASATKWNVATIGIAGNTWTFQILEYQPMIGGNFPVVGVACHNGNPQGLSLSAAAAGFSIAVL
ncbi:hypothetical protein DFJ73DRAFT_802157 [Zopfochytrium polystomum]|nr:hypothetical protein DFJ73DRAFT_802157 [Zopfochytrium polystomum]